MVGVDPVVRIVKRLGLRRKRFLKFFIKRNISICKLVCQLSYDLKYAYKIAMKRIRAIAVEGVGSKNDYLCVGFFLDAFKNCAVVGGYLRVGGGDV